MYLQYARILAQVCNKNVSGLVVFLCWDCVGLLFGCEGMLVLFL